MKVSMTLALAGLMLGTLACGHKEATPDAKALPKVAVSLEAQTQAEGGSWVAATLQSTRTATMATVRAVKTLQPGHPPAAQSIPR